MEKTPRAPRRYRHWPRAAPARPAGCPGVAATAPNPARATHLPTYRRRSAPADRLVPACCRSRPAIAARAPPPRGCRCPAGPPHGPGRPVAAAHRARRAQSAPPDIAARRWQAMQRCRHPAIAAGAAPVRWCARRCRRAAPLQSGRHAQRRGRGCWPGSAGVRPRTSPAACRKSPLRNCRFPHWQSPDPAGSAHPASGCRNVAAAAVRRRRASAGATPARCRIAHAPVLPATPHGGNRRCGPRHVRPAAAGRGLARRPAETRALACSTRPRRSHRRRAGRMPVRVQPASCRTWPAR